jgi:hypothetical protein
MCNFDDKNSLIMQVLKGGDMIDGDSDMLQLTDKELRKCQDKCKLLHIEFPELCALNFEMLLDITITEVIGWDT